MVCMTWSFPSMPWIGGWKGSPVAAGTAAEVADDDVGGAPAEVDVGVWLPLASLTAGL